MKFLRARIWNLKFINWLWSWVVVAQTFKPSTQVGEAGGFQWGWGQPGLQSEYENNQSYRETLSRKTNEQLDK